MFRCLIKLIAMYKDTGVLNMLNEQIEHLILGLRGAICALVRMIYKLLKKLCCSLTLRKHAHVICIHILNFPQLKIFTRNFLIFFLFLLKTIPVRKIQQDSTGSPVGQRQESVWNLIFSLIPNRTVRCLHFPRGIFDFSTWKINQIPVRIPAWQKYCRPKSVFHKCVNN